MLRKTKIVASIGEASFNPVIMEQLVAGGMDVARLDLTRAPYEQWVEIIKTIRELEQQYNRTVALMLDMTGPRILIGDLTDREIRAGEEYLFNSTGQNQGNNILVDYPNFLQQVRPGDPVLVDDGLLEFSVEEVTPEFARTRARNSGMLKAHRGVNLPAAELEMPYLSERDIADVEFGVRQGIDLIAASFVQKAADVQELRKYLTFIKAGKVGIIAKIENRAGIRNLDAIIAAADGIMVARGDMGVEIPVEEVPQVQKRIIRACNAAGKPVVVATQMLGSMLANPRPSRAEVSDVYNAVQDGTDAVMLSTETMIGKYPVESLLTMHRILVQAESPERYEATRIGLATGEVSEALCQAVAALAGTLRANAIIAPTKSGHTAQLMSKFRPPCPVIAITVSKKISRRLAIYHGIYSAVGRKTTNSDELIAASIRAAYHNCLVEPGDRVVLTAGVPLDVAGKTNMIKVEEVSDYLTGT